MAYRISPSLPRKSKAVLMTLARKQAKPSSATATPLQWHVSPNYSSQCALYRSSLQSQAHRAATSPSQRHSTNAPSMPLSRHSTKASIKSTSPQLTGNSSRPPRPSKSTSPHSAKISKQRSRLDTGECRTSPRFSIVFHSEVSDHLKLPLHCIAGLEVGQFHSRLVGVSPHHLKVELARDCALRSSCPLGVYAEPVSKTSEDHPVSQQGKKYFSKLSFTEAVFTPTPFRHEPRPTPTQYSIFGPSSIPRISLTNSKAFMRDRSASFSNASTINPFTFKFLREEKSTLETASYLMPRRNPQRRVSESHNKSFTLLAMYEFSSDANLSQGPLAASLRGRLKGESRYTPLAFSLRMARTIPAATQAIFFVLLLTYSKRALAEPTTQILRMILMPGLATIRSFTKEDQTYPNFYRRNCLASKCRSQRQRMAVSNRCARCRATFLPSAFQLLTKIALGTAGALCMDEFAIHGLRKSSCCPRPTTITPMRRRSACIYINIMSWLLRRSRWNISTSIIKSDIENRVKNPSIGGGIAYPKTFEEKVVVLNDPRTIQKLEIVEFGVKFKPGKKYLSLLLALSGLFFYINQRQLPQKVIDHYFAISNASDLHHPTGYLFAGLMFETPFYIYLPLLAVINQLSKFVSNRWVLGVMAINAVGCGLLGKKLVDERVEEYEVWDQERLCYGEGNFIALANCLWGALGVQGGFTAIKSKLFLKSVPGLGITRAGLPLGYLCLFYLLLQGYLRVREGKKNGELVSFCAVSGFITGLLIRRFAPLK